MPKPSPLGISATVPGKRRCGRRAPDHDAVVPFGPDVCMVDTPVVLPHQGLGSLQNRQQPSFLDGRRGTDRPCQAKAFLKEMQFEMPESRKLVWRSPNCSPGARFVVDRGRAQWEVWLCLLGSLPIAAELFRSVSVLQVKVGD